MANKKPVNFTSPVGRLIGGSLYEGRTTDYDGNPLVYKNGANKGMPRVDFSFGVAFPKTPGATHFSQEPFLKTFYDVGCAGYPNGETQRGDFSWKITDGDSAIPNKKGRKPCDQEGHKGNWVVWFSGSQPPRIYDAKGTTQIVEPGAVKCGYFVQVFGNVTDNAPSATPGIYVNHTYVALSAYGEEIVVGPDVSAAGFGVGVALPAGASTVPVAAFSAPPANMVPAAPGMVMPAAAPIAPPPLPAAPPPVPVVPNPAILAVPQKVMLPAANGATYEAYIAAGWTDAQMISGGILQA